MLPESRLVDLAGFVYLALAAVGLGYAVGLAGIPSLGQGAFFGIGAFAEAIARAKGGCAAACRRSCSRSSSPAPAAS